MLAEMDADACFSTPSPTRAPGRSRSGSAASWRPSTKAPPSTPLIFYSGRGPRDREFLHTSGRGNSESDKRRRRSGPAADEDDQNITHRLPRDNRHGPPPGRSTVRTPPTRGFMYDPRISNRGCADFPEMRNPRSRRPARFAAFRAAAFYFKGREVANLKLMLLCFRYDRRFHSGKRGSGTVPADRNTWGAGRLGWFTGSITGYCRGLKMLKDRSRQNAAFCRETLDRAAGDDPNRNELQNYLYTMTPSSRYLRHCGYRAGAQLPPGAARPRPRTRFDAQIEREDLLQKRYGDRGASDPEAAGHGLRKAEAIRIGSPKCSIFRSAPSVRTTRRASNS